MTRDALGAVIAFLPRAGLGNKLFVFARARLFAARNNLPTLAMGWSNLQIGPILRGERRQSRYGKYFSSQPISMIFKPTRLFLMGRIHFEPHLDEIASGQVYCFNKVPHWRDYFDGIREDRLIVKTALLEAIRPEIHELVARTPRPEIAIHVRSGDFRPLLEGEDFARVGMVRTPLSYFVKCIEDVRGLAPGSPRVTIFTDGKKHELQKLLELPNVSLAEPMPDIAQLLLLSRSKVIILSAGSTFGMWGAYLSEALTISHPNHYHSPIRSPSEKGVIETVGQSNNAAWAPEVVTFLKEL